MGMKIPLLMAGKKQKYFKKILSIQPDSLYGWRMDESSGLIAYEVNGKETASAIELMINNPGFETPGAGGADVFGGWSERAGDGALADETTIVKSGNHAAKITAGVAADTWVNMNGIYVSPGKTITIKFWTRGDGTNAGRYGIYNEQTLTFIRTLTTTGITGTDFAEFTTTFVVPNGCTSFRLYLACPAANGGIAYFDDVSVAGKVAINCIYSPSGITYGQQGVGDGKKGITLNGSASYVQAGTPAFDSIWDGDRGSAIGWGRLPADSWLAQAVNRYIFHPKAADDDTFYIVFGRSTVENTLLWRRRVGGNSNEQTYQFATPTLDWFCMGYAWDISIPILKGFLYSKPTGFIKVFEISGADMDTFGDHPVNDGDNTFYAGSTNSQNWIGSGAHCYYWSNKVLNDDEFRRAMTP